MSSILSSQQRPESHSRLTPALALRQAWIYWLILLFVPFFLFLYVIFHLKNDETPRQLELAQTWFLVSMGYLLVIVPLAAFWRSRIFRTYWMGHTVAPRDYLRGMLVLWLSFEIGGIMSLTGCLVSNSLLPNLLPAMVAFGLFMPLWPSGRSMVKHVGHLDDPEQYEEPR